MRGRAGGGILRPMPARVVVYSTDYCPYCTRAKALLSKKGVAFEEVMVDDRADLRAWLVQFW